MNVDEMIVSNDIIRAEYQITEIKFNWLNKI